MSTDGIKETLVSMERETLAAFKAKDERKFTQYFSKEYVGVANDGVKTADAEVAGMNMLDLKSLSLEEDKVTFPTDDVAVVTYKMMVSGKLQGKDISGPIYCSTVYAHRNARWEAMLHTESKG
jgi:Domain of unknown function (DUF4440)